MKLARVQLMDGRQVTGKMLADGALAVVAGSLLEPGGETGEVIEPAQVAQWLPPLQPPNIIAIGLNYRAHAQETGHPIPTEPVVFIKLTTALCGHQQPIVLPREAPEMVDYEAELAVIMGRTARCVSRAQALDYVLGYTCANDVTARDCQTRRDQQWARAKSFDTFCPLGPAVETDLDPSGLTVTSRLNGQVMQSGQTGDMIFDVPELISFLSRCFTLVPGTVILTGTPPGVGIGRKPPVFMSAGDVIEVEVEGVGILRNTVRAGCTP